MQDIFYQGKRIPKGTTLFLNAWACNMGQYSRHYTRKRFE